MGMHVKKTLDNVECIRDKNEHPIIYCCGHINYYTCQAVKVSRENKSKHETLT